MARPKKIEERQEKDEAVFFIPDAPEERSERQTMPEALKRSEELVADKEPPRYRVLERCKFVVNGGVYELQKDQVISAMTHEIDKVLPQIKVELV